MRTGFGGDRLGLGPIKMWLDGAMSTRTAALTEPYGSGGVGELEVRSQSSSLASEERELTSRSEGHRRIGRAAPDRTGPKFY